MVDADSTFPILKVFIPTSKRVPDPPDLKDFPKYFPLSMIAGHEKQAYANHGQTLKRLAQRGGLSACEALAVLEDRPYRHMDYDESRRMLLAKIKEYEESKNG